MNNQEQIKKQNSDQLINDVNKPAMPSIPRKYADNNYANQIPAEIEIGGEFNGRMSVGRSGKIDLAKGGYATILHLSNLTSDPTDPAVIGDICMVNGTLKRCSVSGYPGTWVAI